MAPLAPLPAARLDGVFASSNYPPDIAAAERFVAEMRHGTLIACSAEGYPQVSILPFVKTGDLIELHCVQADPTFDAVRANPKVTFFVSDFLAWSPHSWVDEHDAGRATLHFRAVAFECDVERTSTDPEDVAGALSRLVAAYEPNATYEPIQSGDFYGARLRRLATMRLRVARSHIKFKTGPAGTDQTKRRVADRLRERAEPGDLRAADVIDASLKTG
jgi:predicted FMN-binding regulatory protein PaiB